MGWITNTLQDLRQYWDAVLPSDTSCYSRCLHFATEASLHSPAPPPGTFAGCSASSRAWWSELRPGRSVYTAGTFCNKGCDGFDAENVVSCRERCKAFCFKSDIEARSSGANGAFGDQSSADPDISRLCVDACTFGCNVREELGLFTGSTRTTNAGRSETKSNKPGKTDVNA
uniref:Uncharacterized protein n=1 Tax=Neospora caninum (strain Liverpool) TaxID=572307 RepID=A0A0F7UFL9_NEOCL|nr:TPA: hypothetical protein BN1204_029205 [Neospora caninum Liverpool]